VKYSSPHPAIIAMRMAIITILPVIMPGIPVLADGAEEPADEACCPGRVTAVVTGTWLALPFCIVPWGVLTTDTVVVVAVTVAVPAPAAPEDDDPPELTPLPPE